MDFSNPPPYNPNLVLLAVITCCKGECRVHLSQWDATASPWKIDAQHGAGGLPTLLIPLAPMDPGDLVLVFGEAIVKIYGLLDSDFKSITMGI